MAVHSSRSSAAGELEARWRPRLEALCDRIRGVTRAALARAAERGSLADLARPEREGVGDVTYGLDALTEHEVERWLDEVAREGPLSLLSEDTGWLHRGPAVGGGKPRELAGFDHGGPRLVLDPVDGTRNLMADLRPAWTVLAFAPPGAEQPRMAEVTAGFLAELPDSRAGRFRVLHAFAGGPCELALREADSGARVQARRLQVDEDDRVDHGYFPFFRYDPELRADLARVETDFFLRLQRSEGAELRHVFDDQYICNAGQLALLALGTYRMIADLRGTLARRRGKATTTSKPYDIAGAVICARAAGCVLTDARGEALDFPLDARTPLDFIGWTNARTQRRLEPHLQAALAQP